MFTTEVKNNKSSSTKSFYLTLQILGFAFSLLFTTSCNQKGYNKIPQKPSETSPQANNPEFAPFPDYTEKTKKHATFNGKVSEFIWQIYQDKNAHYWFGTNHDGILFYDNNSLKHYTSKDGIGGNAVRAILEDQEGNIWFGTSNGLTNYNGNIFKNYTVADGLIDNEIWSITIDRNGLIWIGTVGGVSTFNGKTFKTFEVPKPQIYNAEPMLSQNRVSDILIDKDNEIWFVNDGYGVTKYNGHTFEFYSKDNGLTDNSVADLFEDSNGTIWIGTYYGGVSTYDGNDFTNFTEKGVIKGIETYNFFEDKKGNIWFSAENQGVYSYNGNEFKLYNMADGLATNGIQSIFQDHKGQMWFSTWDGLSLFDGNQIVNASEREPWTD
ncbi:hypothetical protein LRR18_07580 [Mangrovimonas sp. AS39]|uniref:ligand-binding sensor domain-containing protein n=1 Tax=Mangrovimonas futianensis TaxID=2895523 RepID=UPI001E47623F|nr:two-component regulator propeller domain-containing protein [Mangrovimonas futianensis]MCF1191441.1 hypothetical protein [Mangrovimonas futianensis]MCF1195136.1 hypothetical protein [Mangrovimonas futianensis]